MDEITELPAQKCFLLHVIIILFQISANQKLHLTDFMSGGNFNQKSADFGNNFVKEISKDLENKPAELFQYCRRILGKNEKMRQVFDFLAASW